MVVNVWANGIDYDDVLQCSICRGGVEGWGGLTPPHWLKMTATLMTANFCLGGSTNPSPDPASQFANYLWFFSLQHKFVAETVSNF